MERQRTSKFLIILKALGSGKVIIRLNNFHSLSFKAINLVLIELENEYNLEWTHKRHMAHSLWICSQGLAKNKEWKSFEDVYSKMKNTIVEEDKTAEEIMEEVYKSFKGGE